MKTCSKCGQSKELSEFYVNNKAKDGLFSRCKSCHKELIKTTPEKAIKRKLYREANKTMLSESKKRSYYKNQEKYKEDSRQYYHDNVEAIKIRDLKYRNNNKDKISNIGKIYRTKNKEILMQKQIIKQRNRRRNDKYFNFTSNLRNRVSNGIRKYSTIGKTKSCKEYCINFKEIYEHIGPKPSKEYSLDHIIPISEFNFNLGEHVRFANSKHNLRWILFVENSAKINKIDYELINASPDLIEIAKKIGIICH
jgi:hypothetical protein